MPTMDTLHAYETLRSQGGFEDKAAKAVVEAVTSLLTPSFADLATKTDLEQLRITTKADLEQLRLATKADLEQLRQATKADLEQLRLATKADIEQLRQATKADIEQLGQATKADLAEVKADLLYRMQVMALTMIGANLTALAVATGILLKVLGT
ncbi:MAG: coiled-coil domain-containing protein [Nitrospirota bacterium]